MIKRLVKKLFPSRPAPVEDGRGPVLEDGLPVWADERGDDYGRFWSSAAQSWKGACLVTRNADVDRDEMHRQCEYVARNMIRALKLNRDSVVLEVGCGMGAMAYFIAPQVKEYHGADISRSMIEHARRNLAELPNVSLSLLERCDLAGFPDGKFDAAIFEAVLIHLDREDAFRYIEEAYRVLRPGGRAYFMFHSLLAPSGFELFRYVQRVFCDGRGHNFVARNRFHTPEEVRCYCANAGLEIDEEASQLDLPGDAGKIHNEDNILVAICVKPE